MTDISQQFVDACRQGDLESAKTLFEQGADIHYFNDLAIQSASENGHFPVVKFLINNKATVEANDDYSIKKAAKNGHLFTFTCLYAGKYVDLTTARENIMVDIQENYDKNLKLYMELIHALAKKDINEDKVKSFYQLLSESVVLWSEHEKGDYNEEAYNKHLDDYTLFISKWAKTAVEQEDLIDDTHEAWRYSLSFLRYISTDKDFLNLDGGFEVMLIKLGADPEVVKKIFESNPEIRSATQYITSVRTLFSYIDLYFEYTSPMAQSMGLSII